MKAQKKLTYQSAGVDILAADRLVDAIVPLAKKTRRSEVISTIGGYAGLFSLDLKKFSDPVLVGTTDGVGTKLKLAFEMKKFDTIGPDLVAMCVNDLICCGAEPLFFLDYFAVGKLETAVAQKVIAGIAKTLADINCSLLGGETAEMPSFYAPGEFDLAGFAVGAVNRDRIVDGREMRPGDRVIGVASSGVHSNGFSLVRKILKDKKVSLKKRPPGFDRPIGEILLTPTRIYVRPVLALLQNFRIQGIAHITGGGIPENVPRIIPKTLTAEIEKTKINTPPIFDWLKKAGNVPEREMWLVFNMGVGLTLVVREADEKEILKRLAEQGYPSASIGYIRTRQPGESGALLV
ncbi:MAG: phosphoribosylformylglycinamidine cyclo-ligase [Deltaproteobacteria bacterium]|nr:phosphoribosylformylglycinamidine cyclo-ligase [Deltaproteobacteria bacterium]